MNNYRVYSSSDVNQLVKELQLEFSAEKKCNELPPPFYSNGFGSLYNMDAIEFLKSLENESVDLIFADPPYNIKKLNGIPSDLRNNTLNGVCYGLKKHREF